MRCDGTIDYFPHIEITDLKSNVEEARDREYDRSNRPIHSLNDIRRNSEARVVLVLLVQHSYQRL